MICSLILAISIKTSFIAMMYGAFEAFALPTAGMNPIATRANFIYIIGLSTAMLRSIYVCFSVIV